MIIIENISVYECFSYFKINYIYILYMCNNHFGICSAQHQSNINILKNSLNSHSFKSKKKITNKNQFQYLIYKGIPAKI